MVIPVRIRRLLLWVALPALVLVLLYTVLGFYVVPRLLRSGVHDFVTKNYHREIALGEIRFNPYTLRLDVRDFSLPDADGKPMLAFQHLLVDLTVASIWHRGPDFQTILLEQPFARVLIKPDGSLNFSELALPPDPHAQPEPPSTKPARLFIKHFSLVGGNVAFEDLAHPSPFRTEIKPISFDLNDFATVGKEDGAYLLSGASEAGERFSWSGSLSTYPLASRGKFEVADLQAKTIWNYLRDGVQFELPTGTISIAGEYDFTAATSPVGLGVTVHDITVTDLGVRPKGAADDYVKLTRLEVHETRADVGKRTVDVGSVRVAGAEIRTWAPGAGGAAVNLMELAGPNGGTPPAAGAATAGSPAAASPATAGSSAAASPAPAGSSAAASPAPAGSPAAAGPATAGSSAATSPVATVDSAAASPATAGGSAAAGPAAGPHGTGSAAPGVTAASAGAGGLTQGVGAPNAGAAGDAAPWVVSVPDIAIDGVKIAAEDRQMTPAVPVQLDELSVHVTGFSTSHSTPVAVVMSTRINHSGKLEAKADLTPDLTGLKGQADLANLDLTVLQPYIAKQTAMTLRGGLLSTKLNIERAGDGHLAVAGEVDVAKLRTVDNELKRDFIKFDDLKITGIDYQAPPPTPVKPASLHIKNINVRAPYARVIIESDRTVNVSRVLSGPSGGKESKSPGAGVADSVANVSSGSRDTGDPHAALSFGKVPSPGDAKASAGGNSPPAATATAGSASAAATGGSSSAATVDASAGATAGGASAAATAGSASATTASADKGPANASTGQPVENQQAATAEASSTAQEVSAAASVSAAKAAGDSKTATVAAATADSSRKHSKRAAGKSNTAAAAKSDSLSISIDAVNINDGSANYADLWIQPHFAVGIQSLNGSILGLSSNPTSRAKVELKGKVDRYAPVHIWGETNPLAATTYSDIKMSFKGVELTSATPYSGHFAGYKIEKGKLSVDIDYKIQNRQLTAAHKFVIDQLELGDRVESPDAIHLPLKIAVALLKDRNGVIDIDLPVTGSLDDPQFKIGPLIWKAVLNLLTKIATAPFALLGHLFGGGEQMNYIDFHPGSAVLDASEHDKLVALAKALKEKEKLELDVPITFSPDIDRPGLATAHLNQRLLAMSQDQAGGHKRGKPAKSNTAAAGVPTTATVSSGGPEPTADRTRESSPTGGSTLRSATDSATSPVVALGEAPRSALSGLMDAPPPPDPVLTDPAQRYALLVALFKADMGKGTSLPEQAQAIESTGKKKDQPPPDYSAANAELEAALLQKSPVPDTELEVLGKHRARAIQDVLLNGTDIDPSRVFVIGSAPKGAPEKDKVRVELALK
jgi:hypothetical protein